MPEKLNDWDSGEAEEGPGEDEEEAFFGLFYIYIFLYLYFLAYFYTIAYSPSLTTLWSRVTSMHMTPHGSPPPRTAGQPQEEKK